MGLPHRILLPPVVSVEGDESYPQTVDGRGIVSPGRHEASRWGGRSMGLRWVTGGDWKEGVAAAHGAVRTDIWRAAWELQAEIEASGLAIGWRASRPPQGLLRRCRAFRADARAVGCRGGGLEGRGGVGQGPDWRPLGRSKGGRTALGGAGLSGRWSEGRGGVGQGRECWPTGGHGRLAALGAPGCRGGGLEGRGGVGHGPSGARPEDRDGVRLQEAVGGRVAGPASVGRVRWAVSREARRPGSSGGSCHRLRRPGVPTRPCHRAALAGTCPGGLCHWAASARGRSAGRVAGARPSDVASRRISRRWRAEGARRWHPAVASGGRAKRCCQAVLPSGGAGVVRGTRVAGGELVLVRVAGWSACRGD